MFRNFTFAGAALAMTAAAVIPAAPAAAQQYRDGYYGRQYRQQGYDRDQGRTYRGYDQRYQRSTPQQKCRDGDGGTIVGAIAGGLLGNAVAGRGDRTLGTIIGGLGGALAGRAIDRSDRPGYCRR